MFPSVGNIGRCVAPPATGQSHCAALLKCFSLCLPLQELIIALLSNAVAQFKKYKCPRMKSHLSECQQQLLLPAASWQVQSRESSSTFTVWDSTAVHWLYIYFTLSLMINAFFIQSLLARLSHQLLITCTH